MPVLDMDPGQSPEAPGTLSFFEQGKDPATGFVVTSKGAISAPGGQTIGGDMSVTGDLSVGDDLVVTDQLTVNGFTALAAAQTSGDFTAYGGGGISIGTAGAGLKVKEGANARMGTSTLVAGTVTVANSSVTANTRVMLTAQTSGAGPGALRISARIPGTSFTITSTSATDTSSVAWLLLEPAA